ncbi:UNVERIFIED_CONTAM: hypothetical protein Sradi_5057000, partial [Sesamum radiatum]
YFISFSRFEKIAFTSAGDDLPSYLEGYSPDHIAAIMDLPKCPSHDSLEDLDELYDAEVNNSVNSEPDDRVKRSLLVAKVEVPAWSNARAMMR